MKGTDMIIDFLYDADSYNKILSNYGSWPYTCPSCKAVGKWQRHGIYSRYLLVNESEEVINKGSDALNDDLSEGNKAYALKLIECGWKPCRMQILRFKCKICKHTHAILVKEMIPFSVYAIRSIAKIVSYRISGQAIVMAEKENWISHQYFYQCIKRFEQEKPKLSMLYKNQVLENQLADREKNPYKYLNEDRFQRWNCLFLCSINGRCLCERVRCMYKKTWQSVSD